MGNLNDNIQTYNFDGNPDLFKYGRMPERYAIMGMGIAYTKYDEKTKTHARKIDVNLNSVRDSFSNFKEEFNRCLLNDINKFYDKDKNRYWETQKKRDMVFKNRTPIAKKTSVKLDVTVSNSRLSKTSFTYVYQYTLTFSESDFSIETKGNLLDLITDLKGEFTKKLVAKFNDIIPAGAGNLRKESELDLTSTIKLCENNKITDVPKNAPIISAKNGKVCLSNQNLEDVLNNLLRKRARNYRNGEENEDILRAYCHAASDIQIAAVQGLKLFDFVKGSSRKRLACQVLKALLSGGSYGFLPYFAQFNDLYTICNKGGDVGQTNSFVDSYRNAHPDKKDSQNVKFLDAAERIFSCSLSATDIYAFIANSELLSNITGTIGAIIQGAHSAFESRQIEKGIIDVPEEIYDVSKFKAMIGILLGNKTLNSLHFRSSITMMDESDHDVGNMQFSSIMKPTSTNVTNSKNENFRVWVSKN